LKISGHLGGVKLIPGKIEEKKRATQRGMTASPYVRLPSSPQ